jgi:hypothetical protein
MAGNGTESGVFKPVKPRKTVGYEVFNISYRTVCIIQGIRHNSYRGTRRREDAKAALLVSYEWRGDFLSSRLA